MNKTEHCISNYRVLWLIKIVSYAKLYVITILNGFDYHLWEELSWNSFLFQTSRIFISALETVSLTSLVNEVINERTF